MLPTPLKRLIAALSRLPGVGEKTATRYAFHLMNQPEYVAGELALALTSFREELHFCPRCHHLAELQPAPGGDASLLTPDQQGLCDICNNPRRDARRICVIESVQDLIALERTGEWDGVYHVLHGSLSPMRGIGPDQLRCASLMTRVDAGGVDEVILATNADVEGEATALYLRRLVGGKAAVSRIATGVPMGGELEYLDRGTLGRALRDRRQ